MRFKMGTTVIFFIILLSALSKIEDDPSAHTIYLGFLELVLISQNIG